MSKPIDVKGFGGINKPHNRNMAQPSDGKNFRTRQGSLISRPGTTAITPPNPCGAIRSIHTAAKAGQSTRLLLEEGTNLWHRVEGAWSKVKTDVTGNGFNSCRWLDYLILTNGTQAISYNISDGTVADLGESPTLTYVVSWKYRIFGYSPTSANPHLIYYCGEDPALPGVISKDEWPADLNLNIGGQSGSPVVGLIPYNTHLVALTQKGFKRIYGEIPENFQVMVGGDLGAYGPGLSALVRDLACWVGPDKKVYAYTGTSPVPISEPIDELLALEDFSKAKLYSLNNELWLVFSGATTKAYIFDPLEKQWYKDEYPANVSSACMYGEFLAPEDNYFSSTNGTLFKLDNTVSTDIGALMTTEFILGPFDLGSSEFWAENLYVNGEPRNKFNLEIYAKSDRRTEAGPYQVAFSTGTPLTREVNLKQVKGQNIQIRVISQDKINELQKFTLTVTPWGVV